MEKLPPTPGSARWRVVAASVRGTRHERTGQPCQDVVQWRALSDGRLVAALADGAGSAPLAEVGAEIACRTAFDAAIKCLTAPDSSPTDEAWLRLITGSIQLARDAVFDEAKSRNRPARELATTLTLLLAAHDRIAFGQIGDATVLAVDSAGHYSALTPPGASEYLNETTFIVSDGALEKAQVEIRRQTVKQIAALSDGLQMLALKMPAGTPHVPFFAPLFQFVESANDPAAAQSALKAFLHLPSLAQRTDDDLTLLLASDLSRNES
ncbi:MAG: protein phosphatase 2C domain-containing protein [Candidatus Omnitrophica bacterium]|nr:protein phosphatase 2C domain-containing protein [Candidatus Omnitrophota bacterium]